MRAIRLAGIALRAEQARISQRLQRASVQLALLVLALAYLIGGVIVLHVLALVLLRPHLSLPGALACVAGLDLLLALLLLLLAARSTPGPAEREADALARAAAEGVNEAFDTVRLLEALIARLLHRSD